ncbi:MAG: NAD(P)/FAD-dependent oxidoreductase [Galactobacillus timonensis]|uniref:NAD(P)/FAD-dependent oxidoreductase n=1 Tax=Galactobacillus timonensis TaxID=2041840 RepID=UPI0023EFCED1|nr:NAD(P)/FAD-dependent oxidoreductase [Galactobacillus timonensis]MCI6067072.1 NAD(P)/FAD-dependent oxidoreductase [Galactobacillus timonensis]
MRVEDLKKKLDARFGEGLTVRREDRTIIVSGEMDNWHDIVTACSMCVSREKGVHVVNDIHLAGVEMPKMRMPGIHDQAIDGKHPDVLIIGGGISGCSIARELMRSRLSVLVIDKEADVAIQASGRNDGEVHPGVDLNKGSLKQSYVVRGNRMYDRICRELDVPFERCGQYVGFFDPKLRPIVEAYAWQRRHICGVDDTRVISRDELVHGEKYLNPEFAFALFNPMAGVVSPYQLTIAYAENAIANGAEFSLNTAATAMEVKDGRIVSVTTNRGTVYPKLVINAAGVFADDVAGMARDRFYSIHPRRGTDLIMDRKAGALVRSVASWKDLKRSASHSKGGGIIHTPSGNLLIGPDAVETYEKENYATNRSSVDAIMAKQKRTAPALDGRDIITYFTGVRAADFEEDFIIEPGRRTNNLIHVAGIQSPGLTTAPAVAEDVSAMAVDLLQKMGNPVERNLSFNPIRKGIPRLKDMDPVQRNAMIQNNPDYGVVVCRCEEVSKGEIIDAIHNPLGVATVDSIKRRVRPGMGRCQGGFCSPLVVQLIAQETRIPMEDVMKSGEGSWINCGETKEADE